VPRAGRPGFSSQHGQDLFHLDTSPVAPLAYYSMGTRCSFPGGKADHSHPSRAKLRMRGAMSPIPLRLDGMVFS
jgi:hypothetical protein